MGLRSQEFNRHLSFDMVNPGHVANTPQLNPTVIPDTSRWLLGIEHRARVGRATGLFNIIEKRKPGTSTFEGQDRLCMRDLQGVPVSGVGDEATIGRVDNWLSRSSIRVWCF